MSLLASEQDVRKACATLLSGDSVISVDCEGKKLGRKGELSIVQAATTSETFLFDVSETSGAVFNFGLREVLESTAVTKLFFDCRHDADALLHLHRIKLAGVCDLQLLELMLRSDNEEEQVERLLTCLHGGNVGGQPHLYKQVHKLSGLQECLERFDLPTYHHGKQVKSMFRSDDMYWMQRPLPEEAIKYAQHDAQSLFGLLGALAGMRHVPPSVMAKEKALREAAARYADTFRCRSETVQECYFEHALMPLCVLDGFPKVAGTMCMTCNRCQRTMSHVVFSKTAQKVAQKRRCDVCRAIDIDLSSRSSWRDRDSDSGCDGPSYCRYDGPDDPDRYLGGGEFDHDDGYMCG